MSLDTPFKKCVRFLKNNGWKYDAKAAGGAGVYIKDSLVAVELQKDNIILLDDTGDFLYLPMNYYALVGALMEFRQVSANYVSA